MGLTPGHHLLEHRQRLQAVPYAHCWRQDLEPPMASGDFFCLKWYGWELCWQLEAGEVIVRSLGGALLYRIPSRRFRPMRTVIRQWQSRNLISCSSKAVRHAVARESKHYYYMTPSPTRHGGGRHYWHGVWRHSFGRQSVNVACSFALAHMLFTNIQ